MLHDNTKMVQTASTEYMLQLLSKSFSPGKGNSLFGITYVMVNTVVIVEHLAPLDL